MSLTTYWDRQYREGRPIWDRDRPTSELVRTVEEEGLAPCRALELGCGTGTDAVWLARQGFTVTAIDLSPEAIHRARERAGHAGVDVRFLADDLRRAGDLGEPYDFVFDCGCYGAVQLGDAPAYVKALWRLTKPGAPALILSGNDHEPEDEEGPPVLGEGRLRADFAGPFEVVRLREFRFDADQGDGKRYLGWSCLLRRRVAVSAPASAARCRAAPPGAGS